MKEKKQYRTPQTEASQVKPQCVICTSDANKTSISSTEELTEENFEW